LASGTAVAIVHAISKATLKKAVFAVEPSGAGAVRRSETVLGL
jgi:hypothetical protein